jgi:hypothetical protein
MPTLDRASAERLIKLLGLLASPFEGERAAAGLKATELLRARKLTWGDVIRIPLVYHSYHSTEFDEADEFEWARAAPLLPARRPHSDAEGIRCSRICEITDEDFGAAEDSNRRQRRR